MYQMLCSEEAFSVVSSSYRVIRKGHVADAHFVAARRVQSRRRLPPANPKNYSGVFALACEDQQCCRRLTLAQAIVGSLRAANARRCIECPCFLMKRPMNLKAELRFPKATTGTTC